MSVILVHLTTCGRNSEQSEQWAVGTTGRWNSGAAPNFRSQITAEFFSLWLLRTQQQQEVNDCGGSDGMSLQSYIADYRPGTLTTVLLVVNVKADFFKDAKTFMLLNVA